MSKFKLLMLAVLPLIIFSGCLQVNTKINLNKDGSGTIEETFVMKSSVVNMMREFVLAFDSTKTDEFNLFNENELSAKATNYGEGVQYDSGEKVVVDGYEGFKIVYSFADINKIRINPSPEDKVPFRDELGETDSSVFDENLQFNFTKGNPSILIINFPQTKKDKESSMGENEIEVEDSTLNSEQIQKLIEMFDGMKISSSFNFNDVIKETDASYVNGSEITLLQVDFSEIIKHKDVLEKLQKTNPKSMEGFKDIVGKLPGIKVESKETVTIKF